MTGWAARGWYGLIDFEGDNMRKSTLFLIVAATLAYHCGIGDIDRNNSSDPKATTNGGSDTTAPTTPGTFAATVVSATQINLSWVASTDDVTGQSALVYQICQATATGGCNTFTTANTTTAGVVAYSVTGLSGNTTYFFRIRARDGAGNTSSAATEATATTSSAFSNALSLNGGSDLRHLFTSQASGTSYTIELRFKGVAAMTNQRLISLQNSGNATFAEIFISAANIISANYGLGGCSGGLLTGTTTPAVGTTYHVALVANAGLGATLYLNGVQEATAGTPAVNCATWAFTRVGANASGGQQFSGIIDDLRISNVSRYLSGFTPATGPLTNDASTFVYHNFDVSTTTITNTTLAGFSITPTGATALVSSPFP